MNRRLALPLALVALAAPLLALGVAESRAGRAVERRIYDGWFTLRGALPRPAEVVVVAIDTDSEQSLGRYPWSRDWHTRLLRNLHRAGARVVAFDATFADAFPEDAALRAALEETGIGVLGAKTDVLVHRAARGRRLEEPAPALRGAPIGIVDIAADPVDGIIREYPLLHRYPQGHVPQLGVEALRRYLGLSPGDVRGAPGGWRIGERFVPAGPGGGMLVDFLGPPGAVATYSYASVVDDAATDIGDWDLDIFDTYLEEGLFRDRIVLVGSTVPEHQDLHATPFRDAAGGAAGHMPGVEIHAHAVATLLSGRPLRALARPLQHGWTALLAVLLVLAVPRLRSAWGAALALALVALAVGASWYLFTRHGLWLWTGAPVGAVGLSYAGSAAVLFVSEEREKARIRGMFQQYVAESVVDELIRRPELLALGGEERVLTVLFSDVVGFSTVAEGLAPTELVELLNEYLTCMSDVVLAHGGIIDKYQGDALMAEFGAPVPMADHALRACRAALGMKRELARLRVDWERRGRPLLEARIGMNTGLMLLGNLGSRRIMDYTVMGDNVNLASRLEGANKAYGSEILLSEFTWREVADQAVGRELDRIRVTGKREAVGIWELVGLRQEGVPPETQALLRRFAEARGLYDQRRFADALAAFEALAADHPDDGPTAVYLGRCRTYLEQAPPVEWDGVYTMTTK